MPTRSMLLSLFVGSAFALAPAQRQWQEQEQPLQAASPCTLLAATFRGQVLFPEQKAYSDSQSSYWSGQQSQLHPSCRFFPKGATDIQEALADILIPHNVSIAVVSGGHSSNAGASNVQAGVTIDLAELDRVSLADKNTTVYIGPGARWGNVYSELEPHNLTVSGARVAHVGVGGYVLGGGFSWFANKHGWACDSVLEFQVVTPQGAILRATSDFNDDLFWALKGSLGAFGIVTKIKVPTISNAAVYAGIVSYDPTPKNVPRLFDAVEQLALGANKAPGQSGYLSFGWIEDEKQFEYNAALMNVEGVKKNDAAKAFTSIPNKRNTLRRTTIGKSAEEISDVKSVGLRVSKFTLTASCDSRVMMALHEVIRKFASKIQFQNGGILGATYQPLTVPHLQAQSNIFDLDYSQGPLLLVSVDFWWKDINKDEYFEGSAKHLREAMEQELDKLSALHGWIYPNYAARDQNPFQSPRSLSSSTSHMLQAIKHRYDPDNLWGKLVPGIWHV